MPKLACPLIQNIKHNRDKIFALSKISYSYLQLNNYCEQLQEEFKEYEEGSIIAYSGEDVFFFSALFFSCLRLRLRLFSLNFRLSSSEIQSYIDEHEVSLFFKEPLQFDHKLREIKDYEYDEMQPITYLLTSGSTSKPKVCVHSFGNHYYNALGSNEYLDYQSQDSWLLSLPLFHVSGISVVIRTILARATLVQTKNSELENTLKRQTITHCSLIPTQLYQLSSSFDLLKSLKVILIGGAPLPKELQEKAESLPIFKTYGLTEMSSQVATMHPKSKKISTLPYRELIIGKDNEILVRGKPLFLGYLINGVIKKSVNENGWFHTKDLGEYVDENLNVIGRMDNLFISGGENIQPEEIEKYLLKYQGIIQAVIVPKDDEKFGKRPVAFIKSDREINYESLNIFLLSHLPKYKLPLEYHSLNVTGLKPNRSELAKLIKI